MTMAKLKQLVKRTEIEIAERKRTCKFTRNDIPMGTTCVVVYEASRDRRCYSKEVAIKMIANARNDSTRSKRV